MTKKTFHKKKDKSAGPWQSSKSEKYSRVEVVCAVSFDQSGYLTQVTSGSEYMKHVSELNTEKSKSSKSLQYFSFIDLVGEYFSGALPYLQPMLEAKVTP